MLHYKLHKTIYQYLIFTGTLFIVFGCKNIQPKQPKISFIKSEYVQPISTISLPIKIQLDNYLKNAEKTIPQTFKEDKEQCEGMSVSYIFERNPLQLGNATNKLLLELSGKYGIKISYCPKCTDLFNDKGNCVVPRVFASCGINEPLRKIKISTSTSLNISPDYKIISQTNIDEVTSEDKCEVTFVKYNATSLLEKEMKKALLDVTKDLDKKIEEFPLEKEARLIWKQLNEPIEIKELGYLYLNPTKLSKSDIQINSSTVQLQLNLEAYPKVELEKHENNIQNLPALENSKKTEGFNIHLDINGLYSSFNQLLQRNIDRKEFYIKKNKIILDSVRVWGASEQKLSFQVSFSGNKQGVIYLNGTPTYNDSTEEITFPDLTFDLETKNKLLKTAKWLFDDLITIKLRELTRYNIGKELVHQKNQLEKEMNRKLSKEIELKTKINTLKIKSIVPEADKLRISTNATGTFSLLIK